MIAIHTYIKEHLLLKNKNLADLALAENDRCTYMEELDQGGLTFVPSVFHQWATLLMRKIEYGNG